MATNPGQFFYNQWATNPYSVTTTWKFELDWTKDFKAQTVGGGPIKVYLQLAGSSSFVNWTSQSTDICWNACSSGIAGPTGLVTVNNVPAGATVWVIAHIDFSWKGRLISALLPSNPMSRPELYPLSSTIKIYNQSVQVGGSYSQTYVWGRGKKVTMIYGTATDVSGIPMGDTWVQVKQGTNTAMTKTLANGSYVFFDGQACIPGDGIHGSCSGTWTLLNFGAGSVSSSLTFFGQDPFAPTPAATFPASWTKAEVRTATQLAPLQRITTPSYTFTVKKGDAFNRDFRFGLT